MLSTQNLRDINCDSSAENKKWICQNTCHMQILVINNLSMSSLKHLNLLKMRRNSTNHKLHKCYERGQAIYFKVNGNYAEI